MPEIQLLSVLAAAPPAPNSTAGVQYGDANGNANTNTNAADHPRDSFLDQLKSALATVASVALPHKIAPVVDDQPSLPLPPSQDQPEQPKPVSEADMMAEVLTALGLMLVPTPPQPPAAPKSESMTSGDHAAATASLLATLVDNQPQPPHDSSTTPTPAPPANPAPVEAQATPLQPVPAPAPHVAEAKPTIDPAKVQLTSTDPAPAAPIATAATANANMIVPGPNAAAKEASSPQPAPVASAAPSAPAPPSRSAPVRAIPNTVASTTGATHIRNTSSRPPKALRPKSYLSPIKHLCRLPRRSSRARSPRTSAHPKW
jgi:hypothetical protein